MDSGKAIFFNHTLGNEDGVFEVVTVPGHEGDAHVLAQGQLTHIDRRAVCQNVTASHTFTAFHDGALVDAGVLVGAGVLGQVVDINRRLT